MEIGNTLKRKRNVVLFFAGNPCWKGHARRLRVANASTDGASKSPVPKKINQEKRKKKKTPREEGKKNKTERERDQNDHTHM